MSLSTSPDPVATQAINWIVLLHSGEMTESEHAAFLEWRAEDSKHDEACRRIEQTLGHLPQLGASPTLRKVLHRPSNRRQFLQGALSIAAVATAGGWLYDRHAPLTGLLADLHTGTAQRSKTTLSDGSIITLNARSSVDIDFAASHRHIEVIKGQIHLIAAPSDAPFEITTRDGLISLQGGIFTVGLRKEGTRVAALTGSALLRNQLGKTSPLMASQSLLMSERAYAVQSVATRAENAWLDGFIELDDQPLSDLVTALQDYRPGVLRVSPEAARLRVSGIFPLDDTDFTLEALAQTLPVIVSRTTGYWVSISKA